MLIHHEKAKISVNERKGKMCNDVEREMERRVNAVFQSRSGCRLPFRRKETTWISVPKKIENGGYESVRLQSFSPDFSLTFMISFLLSLFHFSCSSFNAPHTLIWHLMSLLHLHKFTIFVCLYYCLRNIKSKILRINIGYGTLY